MRDTVGRVTVDPELRKDAERRNQAADERERALRLRGQAQQRKAEAEQTLQEGQSKAEEFTTLVHELAHEILHKAERRSLTTQTSRETEAEAVAFIVGKAVGLDIGLASADYIQLYHGDAELLAESLAIVQRTASLILSAIQPEESAAQIESEAAGAEVRP